MEEENNSEKKNNKTKIICLMVVITVLIGVGIFAHNKVKEDKEDDTTNQSQNATVKNNTVNNYTTYNSNYYYQNNSNLDNNTSIHLNIINNAPDFKKPIIYLYPEEETEVSVKLDNKNQITTSYPKYIDGWNVLAKPNGDLTDLETGKNLYALYYESDAIVPAEIKEDGFIVKGEDIAEFLEEKLAALGLTDREAEEFIVYWLPRLQENEYNYIRFATMEEINENMILDINPAPDTTIRVLMTYKGLESPIEVKEQELSTPERTGFTVVEWGGTEIK